MSVDLKHAFRLSFVTEEAVVPIPPVSEILARLRSGPVWDGASIAPAEDQFPRVQVGWHEDHGFVIQCYEDAEAWSDFLLTAVRCGPPAIEINLGGQALERWPSELFVPEDLAHQALDCFLAGGSKIRRCIGSESTPSRERLFGKVGKEERLGNARIQQRRTTSNFNWSRRGTSLDKVDTST